MTEIWQVNFKTYLKPLYGVKRKNSKWTHCQVILTLSTENMDRNHTIASEVIQIYRSYK